MPFLQCTAALKLRPNRTPLDSKYHYNSFDSSPRSTTKKAKVLLLQAQHKTFELYLSSGDLLIRLLQKDKVNGAIFCSSGALMSFWSVAWIKSRSNQSVCMAFFHVNKHLTHSRLRSLCVSAYTVILRDVLYNVLDAIKPNQPNIAGLLRQL